MIASSRRDGVLRYLLNSLLPQRILFLLTNANIQSEVYEREKKVIAKQEIFGPSFASDLVRQMITFGKDI